MLKQIFADNATLTWTLIAIDWLIRVALGIRIIMRRSSTGFTLAWLTAVLLLPVLGAIIYLLLGERRLGTRRAKRIEELRKPYRAWLENLAKDFPVEAAALGSGADMIRRQARGTVGVPTLPGNTLQLIDDAEAFFDHLIADIETATSSVHLEFYIWLPGGRADDVANALTRAAARGVKCRILVDDVGGADLVGSDTQAMLEKAGVRVVSMLKVGLLRSMFARVDLRNHRKIAVIDGVIGYTGSQNIADPKLFKAQEGIGEWLDAMVRMTGPAVEALQVTLLADWEFETFEGIEKNVADFDVKRSAPVGDALVQVVPSGPGLSQLAIQELILTVIYAAHTELVLTTPYFIPDDAMIKALLSAAARGVDVQLMLPRYPDSRVVKWAGESYFEELLEGGVCICRYEGGMLHTKAIVIDGQIAMFGSVNLDMRSFYLNFEISIVVYNGLFAQKVRSLQEHYRQSSQKLDLERWRSRPVMLRFAQQTAQLLSPLL
ncbi:MAG: cardiolipin synthase [Planctomycetes bacterium]|nr:cardiolipin synthase [Planctomycetota bacterium]